MTNFYSHVEMYAKILGRLFCLVASCFYLENICFSKGELL